jgi:RNA polymerase sigma factor (sigma-70 family)
MQMRTQEADTALDANDDTKLRARLARKDWQDDPLFVSDEQVFRLLCRARAAKDNRRIGLYTEALSRRLFEKSKSFARRSGIYPHSIARLDDAACEIAQFVWECMVARPGDTRHAQKRFGQLFKRRALDFQKSLLAKKRKCQDSLDALEHSPAGDDTDRPIVEPADAQTASPEQAFELKQEHARAAARLQAILTEKEHSTYVMRHVQEMQVKDIAKALGVTPRSINNYLNSAQDKIRKEFHK